MVIKERAKQADRVALFSKNRLLVTELKKQPSPRNTFGGRKKEFPSTGKLTQDYH